MIRLIGPRALALCVCVCVCFFGANVARAATPPIRHVWVIVLENKDYTDTFGPGSKAPYLSKTLVGEGQLLPRYYGIGHESLDNYIAMVSGQSPNPQTQADCQFFTEFLPGMIGADGQALGQGCVYPSTVKTVADQLEAKGLTWKGYMESMKTNCQHPDIGARDETQTASADNQYAARHNPFIYFHSIIDRPICAQRVVALDKLTADLASEGTTPNFSFITPDLCHDGHDEPCKGINEPGGLVSSDQFLQTWVPRITGSPAFKKDGLLVVPFDESESGADDCCNEPSGPNTPNNGGPDPGNGGGRTGAVLLSRYLKPGVANDTPYNHYSLLRSTENLFGLGHLGYASRPDLTPFGADVYNRPHPPKPGKLGRPRIRILHLPRGCTTRDFTARIRIRAYGMGTARALVDRREVARRHRARFELRVHASRLRPGRHRLTVRASQRRGPRKGKRSRTFRVC